jgi:hypothetical protein
MMRSPLPDSKYVVQPPKKKKPRGPERRAYFARNATPNSQWPLQSDGWFLADRVNLQRDGHRVYDQKVVTAWNGEKKAFLRLRRKEQSK